MDSTTRFSGKAEGYARFRPSYPEAAVETIRSLGIGPGSTAADIGAGTGLFTHALAKCGCRVLAVEPNGDMLRACRAYCAGDRNVEYLQARAEETGLCDGSVDAVTAAQAFHWFDKPKCREEFKRILRPGGPVIILWNILRDDGEFAAEYKKRNGKYRDEAMIRNDAEDFDAQRREFFGGRFEKARFDNTQWLTREEYIGQCLSISYVPKEGESLFETYVAEMGELFDRFQKDGKIELRYMTLMSIGRFPD